MVFLTEPGVMADHVDLAHFRPIEIVPHHILREIGLRHLGFGDADRASPGFAEFIDKWLDRHEKISLAIDRLPNSVCIMWTTCRLASGDQRLRDCRGADTGSGILCRMEVLCRNVDGSGVNVVDNITISEY